MAIIRDPLKPNNELQISDFGSARVELRDALGNAFTSTNGALDINIKSGITINVALDHTSDNVLVYGFDGTSDQKLKTDNLGQLQIAVVASALPSGAATSALQVSANTKLDTIHADLLNVETKQDTGNTSLSSIDTKLTSQATAANQASTNTKLDTLHTDLLNVVTKLNAIDVDVNLDTQAIDTRLDTIHADLLTVETKQDTGNSSLSSIDTKLTSQATAVNQTAGNTKLDTLHTDLVAVEAKQDVGNTSLGSIDAKLSNQATAANQSTSNTKLDTLHTDNLVIETKLDTLHSDLLVVETKQDTGNGSLGSIDTKLTSQATAANQASTNTKLDTVHTDLLVVEGKQDTGNTSLASIDTKLTSQATASNQSASNTKLDTLHSDLLVVEGKQDVGNTSLNSIDNRLSSQATATNQASTNTKLDTVNTNLSTIDADIKSSQPRKMQDGAGNALTSSIVNTRQALDIHQADTSFIVSGLAPAGSAPSLNPVSVAGIDSGGLKRHLLTDAVGILQTAVASSALPTGGATSANQTSGNSSVASIDTKTPALGQAIAASSVPVVLTAIQIATLTPLSAVTANIGTTNGLALDSSVNSLLKPSSALSSVTSITNTVTVKADTLINQANPFKVDGSATTQPVSGVFFQATQPISAATLPLPTGAATAANQTSELTKLDTINTNLATIDTDIKASQPRKLQDGAGNAITSTAGALDVNIKGDAITIQTRNLTPATDGVLSYGFDGTSNQKIKTDAAGIVQTAVASSALPVGGATSANQTTEIASINQVDTDLLAFKAQNNTNFIAVNTSINTVDTDVKAGTTTLHADNVTTQAKLDTVNASLTTIDTDIKASQPRKMQDGLGNAITSTSGALDVNIKGDTITVQTRILTPSTDGILSYGFDGTNNQKIKTDVTGVLQTAITSSALPAGAATSANQATELATLSTIATNTANTTVTQATGTNLHTVVDSGIITANIGTTNGLALDASVNTLLKPSSTLAAVTSITNTVTVKADTLLNQTNAFKVDGSAVTQPVSAASLPLPAGAATSANQTSELTKLDTLNASLTTIDSDIKTSQPRKLQDGAGNAITSTAGALDVNIKGDTITVQTRNLTPATDGVLSYGFDGTNNQKIKTDVIGILQTAVTNSVLPSGASTSALQTSGNTSLSSIDSKVPALGQALAVASVPIVLTAIQLNALTPLSTVTANIGTTNGLALDSTLTGGTQKAVLRTAAKGTTIAADTTSTPVDANTQALDVSIKGTVATTLSGTPAVSVSNFPASQAVIGSFFQATQPVSAASLPLPTGASTETTLSALNTKVTTTINGIKVDGSAVTQPVSGAFFQATQPVSGTVAIGAGAAAIGSVSVSNFPTTQNVNVTNANLAITAASLPLPTGAATSANQTSVIGSAVAGTAAANSMLSGGVFNTTLPTLTNGQQAALQLDSLGRLLVDIGSSVSLSQNVSQFGGSNVVTGTGVSGAGIPRFTVSSDSNILATQSGVWNVGLNAGVNAIGSVSVSNFPATQNVNVTNASIAITAASLPLPAGAATSANQATELATLSTIATNTANTTVTQATGTNLHTVVDNFPATQIVSGAVTANIGTTNGLSLDASTNSLLKPSSTLAAVTTLGSIASTVNVAAASLPLPAGAATAANQTSELTKLDTINTNLATIDTDIKASQPRKMQDGAGNALTSSLINGRQALDIHQSDTSFIVSGLAPVGSAPSLNPVSVAGVDGAGLKRHLLTDATGILQTAITSSALATGASTSALQTSGNSSLSSIDSKVTTTVNGIKVDVQASALPTGAATAANQTTEIASLASIVTNTANTTVTQATGTNLHTVVDSGIITTVGAVTAITNALPAGANIIGAANVNVANASAVIVMQNAVAATGNGTSLVTTGYGTSVLQISGTFVASIAFEASVDAGTTWVGISATQIGQGDIFTVVTIPGLYRLTVTGMDLIRARVTWTSGTSITINGRSSNAVNASKVVKLATGANIVGKVGIDQTTPGTTNLVSLSAETIKVIGTVNVAGTVPVSLISTTITNTVATTLSGTPSVSVSNFPASQAISAATLPLPTGAATSALQSSGNASLASIDTKTPTLGQQVAAASQPVVLTAAQLTTLTPLTSIAVSNFPATQNTAQSDTSGSGTITAAAQTVSIATGFGDSTWNVGFSGTFSAGTNIIFEGTVDGTNWIPLNGRQSGFINTTLANNVSGGSGVQLWRGNTSGISQFRVRCNTFTVADSIVVTIRISAGVGAIFLNASIPVGNNTIGSVSLIDGIKATYSASIAAMTLGNSAPTDILVIAGSASKTIRITAITFSGTRTTAQVSSIQIVRRSTATTGGTPVTLVGTSHDTGSIASTTVVTAYSTAPTVGTQVGSPIRSERTFQNTTTAAVVTQSWNFGKQASQSVVLKGTSQFLALNLIGFGTGNSGGILDISIEWTEE